jgi:membrane protease YdiL (CAAX protease family)
VVTVREDDTVVGSTSQDRARAWVASLATVVVLALWNLLARPALSSGYDVAGGLVVAAAVVAVGTWGGLGLAELGLSPSRLRSGLAWGGAAFGLVAVVILFGLALPASRTDFHTARGQVGAGELLVELLVTIPLGTVVVEELAFRGVLLGLLLRLLTPIPAVVVCSVLFGLWHVRGVVDTTGGSHAHVVAAALGTVLATGGAGAVFCWLRLRSGSLIAPVLAHLATNTLGLVATWLVVH